MAKPLAKHVKKVMKSIEKIIYATPAFVETIRASIPLETLQAVLTDEQKQKIKEGALKLMTKKDGSLMATLVNPETKKIVAQVPLKSVEYVPELANALASYNMQMQMADIAEQIQLVQEAIEEVRQGQEYDRLATAYSCQQKLMQILEIKKPELREMALLSLASDAEDSRNLLMLSQKNNIQFIQEQPESFWGKVVANTSSEKISQRMIEIRENLNAVNMVSLAEAMSYVEMDELDAARKSLEYYAEYIDDTYLKSDGLLQRLDLIDPATENYWTNSLPEIQKKIVALPYYNKDMGGYIDGE